MPTTYAIPNGRTVMDATLYTGTNANLTTTNIDSGTVGFKPDLVWIKSRSNVTQNVLQNSVTGPNRYLISNSTGAEGTDGSVTSFNSNGFSLTTDLGVSYNYSGYTYVGWQWNAGSGSNVTNTTGTITSTVSANATAGFSIVTYAGSNASATVGHGLSAAPTFIICKSRTSSSWNWLVNVGAITGSQGDYLYLNSTQAVLPSANVINANATVLNLLTSPENNGTGQNYVTYCWTPIPGFSAFGKYTGNANADGPFVYTGFRPKFIMIKNTANGISDWTILDSSRSPYNVANLELNADLSGAEYVANAADFLSNGFKLRSTYGNTNGNSQVMIYAAFAENPFKYANAR